MPNFIENDIPVLVWGFANAKTAKNAKIQKTPFILILFEIYSVEYQNVCLIQRIFYEWFKKSPANHILYIVDIDSNKI